MGRKENFESLRIGSAKGNKLTKGFRCFDVLPEMEVSEAPNGTDWFSFSKKKGEYFPMGLFDEEGNLVTVAGEVMTMKVESSIESLPSVSTDCPQMKGIYWFFRVLPHVPGIVTVTFSVKDSNIPPLVNQTIVIDPNAPEDEYFDESEDFYYYENDMLIEDQTVEVEVKQESKKRKSSERSSKIAAKPPAEEEQEPSKEATKEVKRSHKKKVPVEAPAAIEVEIKEEAANEKTPARSRRDRDRKSAASSSHKRKLDEELEEQDDDDYAPRKRHRVARSSATEDEDFEEILQNSDDDEDTYENKRSRSERKDKGRIRRAPSHSDDASQMPPLAELAPITPYPARAVEMFVSSIQPPPLIDPLSIKHRLEPPFMYTPRTPQPPLFPASIHHNQPDLSMGSGVFRGVNIPVNLLSYLHRDYYMASVMLIQHAQTHIQTQLSQPTPAHTPKRSHVSTHNSVNYISSYPQKACIPNVTTIFAALQQKCAHVLSKTHMLLMMRKLFEDVFLELVYEHERDVMEKMHTQAYVEKRLMGDVVGVNFFLRFLAFLLVNVQNKGTAQESASSRVKGPLQDVEKVIEHGFRLLDDNFTAWCF